jgi:hypothetical protein
MFPKLAFLAQLARNTDNVVGVASGDLETMTTMLRAAASGHSWDIGMEAAKSSWDGKTPLAALGKVASFFLDPSAYTSWNAYKPSGLHSSVKSLGVANSCWWWSQEDGRRRWGIPDGAPRVHRLPADFSLAYQ